MSSVVSDHYAEALYTLAIEENAVDQYLADMKLVESVMEEDPNFVAFFSHVNINNEVKTEIIDKAFAGSISHYVLNFLKLLVQKRRIQNIKDIAKSFIKKCQAFLGIEEGIVYSAFELSEQQKADIEKAIGQKERKTIVLRNIIDPSIVGGVRVQISNRVYDGSVKKKVSMLKEELLRK
ncbi:MAG: F0F1 ATP synthase subunit delta [Erysipelotrichaceae bacterium]|nr:F0F1 ATP synthase subunit delta [Erysipelotrichaceae bacterium]